MSGIAKGRQRYFLKNGLVCWKNNSQWHLFTNFLLHENNVRFLVFVVFCGTPKQLTPWRDLA